MLNIIDKEHYEKVIEFAKKIGKEDDLKKNLDYLDGYACNSDDKEKQDKTRTRCDLYKDIGDEPSFYFIMMVKKDGDYVRWFNGGCIFHGPHDGFGSGSAPVFAVTITPTHGWSIHT